MTIWGTARPLFARFEVGQNSRDLLAKFVVGQGSEGLYATLIVRVSASTDLSAKVKVYNPASAEAYAHFIVRQPASAELYGHGIIRNADSAELYAHVVIQDTEEIYGLAEIRNIGSAELLVKFEVGQGSQELYAHVEIQDIEELYAHSIIRQPASADLSATFEVGQGSQDLLARFEVGQNSADLFGLFELVNIASQDLLVKVVITHSVELYGKVIIARQGAVQNLLAKFEVGQNSRDLWGSTIIQHPAETNLYGALIVQHPGTPTELYGHAEIRQSISAEAYAHLIARGSGAQDLLVHVNIGDVRDLYAHFRIGFKDSTVVLWEEWIDELDLYVQITEIGEGFIGMAFAEMDGNVKVVGLNSFKITSDYEAGGFKEIKFGWKHGFVSPVNPAASAYFDTSGGIWWSLDDPEGWGGWYWDRQ